MLQIRRDPKAFQKIDIVFIPLLKIKNNLPFPIKYVLKEIHATVEDSLLPREEKSTYDLDIREKTSLEIA